MRCLQIRLLSSPEGATTSLRALLLCANFLSSRDFLPGSVIFSDRWRAYTEMGRSVISEFGMAETMQYPSAIHAYLSPNDNHYHGAAKAKWRGMAKARRWGPKDGVESDLCLLGILTHTNPDDIRKYFTRNLFLGRKPPSKGRCMRHIEGDFGRKTKAKRFFHQCSLAFHRHAKKRARTESTSPIPPTS